MRWYQPRRFPFIGMVVGAILAPIFFWVLFRSVGSDSIYSQSTTAEALYGALFVRRGPDGKLYGQDRVDPLYWRGSTYLNEPNNLKRAKAALQDFLKDESGIAHLSAVQRAFLQNDLWRLFNLSTESIDSQAIPRSDQPQPPLVEDLSEAVRRLALSEEEVRGLPDNLAIQAKADASVPDFDDPSSDWVAVHLDDRAVAPAHLRQFEGRSTFTVYLRVPRGREAALSYLAALNSERADAMTNDRSEASVYLPMFREPPFFTRDLPALPAHSQFALVRRLIVLDQEGSPHPSPLVQSVQIRTILPTHSGQHPMPQDFAEFPLSRRALFAGDDVTLFLVKPDGRDFSHFFTHEIDQLSPSNGRVPVESLIAGTWLPRVYNCTACHGGSEDSTSAILTMNSYTRQFSEKVTIPPMLMAGSAAESEAVDARYYQTTREGRMLLRWLKNYAE